MANLFEVRRLEISLSLQQAFGRGKTPRQRITPVDYMYSVFNSTVTAGEVAVLEQRSGELLRRSGRGYTCQTDNNRSDLGFRLAHVLVSSQNRNVLFLPK